MLSEFLNAFGLIFLAEMGDKTQLLALAFATRYRVRQVLWGIFFGVLLNHGLAVLLGNLLSTFIPLHLIQLFAGVAFMGFALWSLRVEEDEDEADETSQRGPIVTVALAFFIGELGDKTQLSAITLSSVANYPLIILAGTTAGMLLVGALGIIVGRQLGARIPETALKMAAAVVFAFFGIQKLLANLPAAQVSALWLIPALFVYVSLFLFLLFKLRAAGVTPLQKQAQRLKEYYENMAKTLEDICLHCQTCEGKSCHVGYSKLLVSEALEGQPSLQRFVEHSSQEPKRYHQSAIARAQSNTDRMLEEFPHDLALLSLKKQLLHMQEPHHLPDAQHPLEEKTRDSDDDPTGETE